MPSEDYIREHEEWQRAEEERLNREAEAERELRAAEREALADYERGRRQ